MEIVWNIFVAIWVCCLIGLIITRVISGRYDTRWYTGILVSNFGVLISYFLM